MSNDNNSTVLKLECVLFYSYIIFLPILHAMHILNILQSMLIKFDDNDNTSGDGHVKIMTNYYSDVIFKVPRLIISTRL